MTSDDSFFQDFESMSEEQWQEFAFASVEDVHKLIRKNQSGITLKPLYTQRDIEKLKELSLLSNFSREKTKSIAVLSNLDEYKQARGLEVKSFLLKLNHEDFNKEEFFKPGTKSENLFIEFLQNPDLEYAFWENHLRHYITKYYLYDPITFSLKQEAKYQKIEKLSQVSCCVDAAYFSSLGLSDLNELSHAMLLFDHYLQDIPEDKRKSAFAKIPLRISLGSDFFQNLAKVRALNLLLQRYFFSLFGEAYRKESFIIIGIGKYSERIDSDLHTNILRETTANISSQLSGMSYFQNTSFDKSSQAKRLALNTFTIISDECFAQNVFDPAAGSYYLETLTDQYAQQAWLLFNELKNNLVTHELIIEYFFEGDFFELCLKDQEALKDNIVIGKTHFLNNLDSCLNRENHELGGDSHWNVYDLKKQNELEEQIKLNPSKEYVFNDWESFKERMGFEYEFLTRPKIQNIPFYKKGDNHE